MSLTALYHKSTGEENKLKAHTKTPVKKRFACCNQNLFDL